MQRVPSLDGIRAIAVMAVFALHTKTPGFDWGFLGVDAFFVLSGFLITRLLAQQDAEGGISLGRFYLRRAARLYPALLLMVALYLAFAWVFPEHDAIGDSTISLLYLSDYAAAFWNRPRFIGHTWSLSVEEHFYLLWPLLLPLLLLKLQRRHALAIMAVLYAGATVYRMWSEIEIGNWQTMFRFDTRISGLILGSILALAPMPKGNWRWLAAAAVCGVIASQNWPTTVLPPLGMPVVMTEAITACLIIAAMNGGLKALAHPWIVYVGKISYGIYLFHFPIVLGLSWHMGGWNEVRAVALLMTFAVAFASYNTIERYFMRMPMRRVEQAGPSIADPSPG